MPGLADEVEGAGGADLDADAQAAEKALACGGAQDAVIEGEGALGPGVGLWQTGSGADDLGAGQREVPAS